MKGNDNRAKGDRKENGEGDDKPNEEEKSSSAEAASKSNPKMIDNTRRKKESVKKREMDAAHGNMSQCEKKDEPLVSISENIMNRESSPSSIEGNLI